MDQPGNGRHLENNKPKSAAILVEPPPTEHAQKHSSKFAALKPFIPFRPKPKVPVSPYDDVGFFGTMFSTFITRLVWKAFKKKLTFNDIGTASPYDSIEVNANRLYQIWTEEVTRRGAQDVSMLRVFWRFLRTRMIVTMATGLLFFVTFFVISTFFVQRLLEYTAATDPSLWTGIALVVGMFLLEVTRSFAFRSTTLVGLRSGTKVIAATIGMGYQKVMRLQGLKDKTVGELVNLFVTDSFRIGNLVTDVGFMFVFPIMIFPLIGYAVYIMGPWALLGIGVTILMLPIEFLLGLKIMKLRKTCVKIADERVRMTSEMLNSVKLIKMYAWEKPFIRRVEELRARETKLLQFSGFLQSVMIAMLSTVVPIASVITFSAHVMTGNDLKATQAFTMVSCFHLLSLMLMLTPELIRLLAECVISARRLKSLMVMEERDTASRLPDDEKTAIDIKFATFAWDALDKAGKEKRQKEIKAETGAVEEDTEPTTVAQDGQTEVKLIQTLFDVNLTIKKRTLLGVCGSVGAGKSSLISAILKEMRVVKGEVAVDGGIAYVAQQAWIQNATVRDNILLGKPFDSSKYEMTVQACCLRQDFEQLPGGDMTEIGERGINLSGGQKQRVSLARALYADKDIYLLDDPLSAVDAHVGEHIFRHYIKKMLRGKTVVLITHQLQHLSDCDEVLLLKDGRIAGKGPHRRLMTMNAEYAEMIQNYLDESDDGDGVLKEPTSVSSRSHDANPHLLFSKTPITRLDEARWSTRSLNASKRQRSTESTNGQKFSIHATPRLVRRRLNDKENAVSPLQRASSIRYHHPVPSFTSNTTNILLEQPGFEIDEHQEQEKALKAGNLTQKEEIETGKVKLANYTTYIQSSGILNTTAVLLVFTLNTATVVFSNFWLSNWIEQGDGKQDNVNGGNSTGTVPGSMADNPDVVFYVSVFGGTAVLMLLLVVLKSWLFSKATLAASYHLYRKVFQSVFRSSMSFFDTTPTGRIINRFSKDTDNVDVAIPLNVNILITNLWNTVAAFVAIGVVLPSFLAAVAVLLTLFCALYYLFQAIIRELRRFENILRTPWLCHVTETLNGLTTIHAFNMDSDFIRRFNRLMDDYTNIHYLAHMGGNWAASRVEMIALVISVLMTLTVVLLQGTIPATQAGLAITYAFQVTGFLQFMTMDAANAQAAFTSVERLRYYITNLTAEAPDVIEDRDHEADWPSHGEIQLHNLSMRYRENLPLVLKSISCNIRSREKIGIVGRTGSGKSSLGVAIFRLVEAAEGTINIDGVDISKIGLSALRSKLSIIPQDPVLFVGTVRYNLDPFSQYSDDQIWKALERVYMDDAIRALDLKLNSAVVENGENFSVGERQLMCMARALLRNSKILILDEATAAIDSETDTLIQTTIHEAFEDCTMLTIAHRLNTVMTSDRVMVMDDGQLSEFDTPRALLANQNSRFAAMVKAAGIDVTKYITMETDDVPAAEENSPHVSETDVECTKL
ncbi:multidrug resistance-associated protein 5-like [Branchiostoma floridae]|uniref:Multidrug resistance-associated protein 5-like n=1 Tax=Branchiostoma floridae TaxID=7739 RepID=A0A9J7HGP7_BRAFL|nr:multidrug resistance-associated protein 5-like [Branchiostoma floridae]